MPINAELAALFDADQADRADALHPEMVERDRARRRRVAELIESGALAAPVDYFYAAMVFQHGEAPDDFRRAHDLALRAAEMGHEGARWLAAAAEDRYLMHQGRPQRFGTQYASDGARWRLHEVDPATTDEERAAWGVPPLAEALRRAEEMTREQPPAPALDLAPYPVLAALEVPGLVVEVHRFPAPPGAPPGEPPILPLGPDDPPLPRPAYLPPGTTLARIDAGGAPALCAIDADGRVVLIWTRSSWPGAPPVGSDRKAALLWQNEGQPRLEAVDLGGRSAILVTGPVDCHPTVFVPAGAAGHWIVGGRLDRAELIRVAASLPRD